MAKPASISTPRTAFEVRRSSNFGRKLRKLATAIRVSGERPLSRSQAEREMIQGRGGFRSE
jgi:hypothetical protein